MGKKNKKQKDDLEIKDTKKDPNQEEDNDKVSIKKTFRDTGIIMALIAVITGIVVFVNRDALDPDFKIDKGNEDDQQNIDEADPEIAYNNLVALANKQLIETRHLNANLEYVSILTSLEYTQNKITYCALANAQEIDKYLVKVTMNHFFEYPGDFVYAMTNLKLTNSATTYGVSCEVMKSENGEYINEKFDELKMSVLTEWDTEKIYKHQAYRADGSETYYFSVTYAGTDSKIYSTNEMEFNQSENSLTMASKYSIAPTESDDMYELFNIILEKDV